MAPRFEAQMEGYTEPGSVALMAMSDERETEYGLIGTDDILMMAAIAELGNHYFIKFYLDKYGRGHGDTYDGDNDKWV